MWSRPPPACGSHPAKHAAGRNRHQPSRLQPVCRPTGCFAVTGRSAPARPDRAQSVFGIPARLESVQPGRADHSTIGPMPTHGHKAGAGASMYGTSAGQAKCCRGRWSRGWRVRAAECSAEGRRCAGAGGRLAGASARRVPWVEPRHRCIKANSRSGCPDWDDDPRCPDGEVGQGYRSA